MFMRSLTVSDPVLSRSEPAMARSAPVRLATVLGACGGLWVFAPTARAQSVGSSVVKCSPDNGATWRTNCDDPPTSGAAAGLNPTVAAAANSLGQALGQALFKMLLSKPKATGVPQPDPAAAAAALKRAQFARTKAELEAALGIAPGSS